MAVHTHLQKEVLRTYRHILKIARTWQATVEANTSDEREYIRNEARTLFRRNKNISAEEEIKLCLEEARSRIEIAFHYQNPYPRPVNVPPSFVSLSQQKKAQVRRTKQSKPVYVHSQDH